MEYGMYVGDTGTLYRVSEDGRHYTPLTDAEVDGLDAMLERQAARIQQARERIARREYTLVDQMPKIKEFGGEGISRQRQDIPGSERHG